MPKNQLFFGDNLKILREKIPGESVDLIYLDPPFNSNQDYNVLFSEKNGSQAEAQIKAFEDTWRWDEAAAAAYHDVVEGADSSVSKTMQAFRQMIGENDMLAYLAMMAPRLVEMRRVLKNTGSIYLHCDPTASHYLKLLMDAIFGPVNYKNEIVWQRFNFHADAHRFGRVTDRILFYSKSKDFLFHSQRKPFSEDYINEKFSHLDENGRKYRLDNLNPPGGRGPIYEFCGITRPWRYKKEKMMELDNNGYIYKKSTIPQLKRFLDELEGQAVHELWNDIAPINPRAKERLGYPTQKPESLLERIILSSSNEGEVILDPFCGCGTSIIAAQHLKRHWIGIDITFLAIALMRFRLINSFGNKLKNKYEIHGLPESVADAVALAEQDTHEFELWALGLVDARPLDKKKGADRGIDGRLYFHEDPNSDTRQIIISVKSGHTGVSHVRDLRGVIEREKAEIGVLITLQEPTKPMRTEAASAGFFESAAWNSKHPRIQILTVEELLDDRVIDYPAIGHSNVSYKKAQKKTSANTDHQKGLALED